MSPRQILVADVLCAVSPPYDRDLAGLDRSFEAFATTAPPSDPRIHKIVVRGHRDGLPEPLPSPGSLVFDQEAYFRFYAADGRFTLLLFEPDGGTHYGTAIFNEGFREVDVHYRPPESGDPRNHPLTHPIHHLLVTSVLAQGHGLSLHACGVLDDGKGYLFPGHSGAGKSTLGRLWDPHATVLNDERIVLRLRDGQLWIYGTPWLGENRQYANAAAPLHKIFFLDQAPENRVTPLGGADVATRLISHSLLPLWMRDGMAFVTEFAARVAESVDCHLLGFVPDESIVPFLRCVP